MKHPALIAIAILALACCGPALAGDIKQIDRRPEGHEGAGFVVFASNSADHVGQAFSFIGLIDGDSYDTSRLSSAFGMWRPEGRSATGAIPDDAAAVLLATADVLAVHVDAGQYRQVADLYHSWSAREFDQSAAIVCLNYTGRVVRGLSLKAPYQSGFSVDASGYYQDLATLNRPRDK